MKIGFFGNANNYPFMVARALNRMGHEVTFLIGSKQRLDRPEYRYTEISYPYPEWILDLSPVPLWHFVYRTRKRRQIVRRLQECDVVFLNGWGVSLASSISRPTIAMLSGSDLDYCANFKTLEFVRSFSSRWPALPSKKWPAFPQRLLVARLLKSIIPAQREGIRKSIAVNYLWRGLFPEGDSLLDEIGVPDSRRMYLTVTDVDVGKPQPLPHRNPTRVVCLTRLTWKRPIPMGRSELDFKGSDVMIRGLGLFSRLTGMRLDIRIAKKGMHIQETVNLVEEEGLVDQVTWLEELTQREAMDELRDADIVFEQFGITGPGIAAREAMAMGRPVIANGRPDVTERYTEPLPICQASTPEEVCAQLKRLVFSRTERESVAAASRRYAEKYFSPDVAARMCLERINGFVK